MALAAAVPFPVWQAAGAGFALLSAPVPVGGFEFQELRCSGAAARSEVEAGGELDAVIVWVDYEYAGSGESHTISTGPLRALPAAAAGQSGCEEAPPGSSKSGSGGRGGLLRPSPARQGVFLLHAPLQVCKGEILELRAAELSTELKLGLRRLSAPGSPRRE